MCGIVGYIGGKQAVPLLLESLKRLEYRGYDSAGIAILTGDEIICRKTVGKVAELERIVKKDFPWEPTIGMAHTRWATHGEVTEENAHPHLNEECNIAIVHNGIIENHRHLKSILQSEGHLFRSKTDSEVLVHLIEKFYSDNLEKALHQALLQVEGTYGVIAMCSREPGKLVASRSSSPIIVGIGNNELFITSDIHSIAGKSESFVSLKDGEIAVLTREDFSLLDRNLMKIDPDVEKMAIKAHTVTKGSYAHYMLKEIYEQPESVLNAMRGRLDARQGMVRFGGFESVMERLSKTSRIIITSCGTSWHAGLVGEYLIEEMAGIPTEVEYASEFRYRNPVIENNDVVIALSQSGETADTLAAVKEAKIKGACVIGICNVVGSSLAQETDAGIYIHAGPEIGVASTKAFTSQLVALAMISLLLGRQRRLSVTQGIEIVRQLTELPQLAKKALQSEEKVKEIARRYYNSQNFLYLGRGYNYPVALEGALKLKEISYIHAEGYPAAEMKHGPIALIDENMPAVVIATKDPVYEKVCSNIEEILARKGNVIVVATEGDENVLHYTKDVIYVPDVAHYLSPVISVIPLQLLAYHIAALRGCEIDQPRNLAKSVTVE